MVVVRAKERCKLGEVEDQEGNKGSFEVAAQLRKVEVEEASEGIDRSCSVGVEQRTMQVEYASCLILKGTLIQVRVNLLLRPSNSGVERDVGSSCSEGVEGSLDLPLGIPRSRLDTSEVVGC